MTEKPSGTRKTDMKKAFLRRLDSIYEVQEAAESIRKEAFIYFRNNINMVNEAVKVADQLVKLYTIQQLTKGNVNTFDFTFRVDAKDYDKVYDLIVRNLIFEGVKPTSIPSDRLADHIKSVTFTPTKVSGLWIQKKLYKEPVSTYPYSVVGINCLRENRFN
jgi:hypothetical protein